jgi:serine protease
MCLVDTGVDMNPDTENTVVDRVAIDGGSGSDTSPTQHGTILAMLAAAPANNWGTIGTAPDAIQIVSVDILEPGQVSFPFSAYAAGINTCLELRARFDIKTINLSLGSSELPTSENSQRVTSAIEKANSYGVAIVAAAGNDDGGAVGYPAAYPGGLSVAASDSLTGSLCSFSNRGEGLRLIAPGCDLDAADPTTGTANFDYYQGTSEASAIADSALTALMAYQPQLSPQAAEQDLTTADNGSLNIAGAFRNAGLGQLVTEGEAAEPNPTPATPSAGSPGESHPQTLPPSTAAMPTNILERPRFAAPDARLSRHRGHLELLIASRPAEAQAEVHYLARHGHSHQLRVIRSITGVFETLTLPASGVLELTVRYTDPYDIQRSSPWTTLKLPPSTAHRR